MDLWDDRGFIVKRILEQGAYKHNLEKRFKDGKIDLERKNELDESCHFVYKKFVRRLTEIDNGRLAHLVEHGPDTTKVDRS